MIAQHRSRYLGALVGALVFLSVAPAWAGPNPPADIQFTGEVRDDGFGRIRRRGSIEATNGSGR